MDQIRTRGRMAPESLAPSGSNIRVTSSYELLSMLLLDTFRCFARRSQGMSRERIVHTFLVNGFWGRGYYVRFCKLFSRAISIVIEYIIVNVKKKKERKENCTNR